MNPHQAVPMLLNHGSVKITMVLARIPRALGRLEMVSKVPVGWKNMRGACISGWISAAAPIKMKSSEKEPKINKVPTSLGRVNRGLRRAGLPSWTSHTISVKIINKAAAPTNAPKAPRVWYHGALIKE